MPRRSNFLQSSPISKADILLGVMLGRVLIEYESFTSPQQRGWINELLDEGKIVATEWRIDSKGKYRILSKHKLENAIVEIPK